MLNKLTTNSVFAGLLSAGLLLLPLWLPLLTPIQMAMPLPILLVALRVGNQAGWQAVTILLGCTWLVSGGMVFPLAVFVLFAAFPLLAARLLRGGWRTSQCALVAFLIGNVVLLGILAWGMLGEVDLPVQLTHEMNALKDGVLTSLATQEVDAITLAELRSNLDQLIALISLLLPAMVLTSWFLIQMGNLLVARTLINRWAEQPLAEEVLANIRLPFTLVWMVIAMALLALFSHGALRYLGINWGIFLSLPYFFQGLAIVQQGLQHYKIGGFVRGVLYTALFFWTGMILLVLLIGLFDTWIDFRLRFFYNKEGQTPSGR